MLRFGTLVLAVCAAWTSPLASERQVLTFRTRAWLSFAPPTCRMPLGQASGFSRADPGGRGTPRFRHRLIRFRHFIGGSLALASLNLAYRDHVPAFPQRSPPRLLPAAACGGLRSAPDHRTREGPPSSLVQLRAADNSRAARDTRPNADVRPSDERCIVVQPSARADGNWGSGHVLKREAICLRIRRATKWTAAVTR